MKICDEDKKNHSVSCKQHSELFKDEWTQKWEVTLDRDLTIVRNI